MEEAIPNTLDSVWYTLCPYNPWMARGGVSDGHFRLLVTNLQRSFYYEGTEEDLEQKNKEINPGIEMNSLGALKRLMHK